MAALPTLSGMFAVADAAYAENAETVNFTANVDHGYLEFLFIDYRVNMADEEISFNATGFARDAP